MTDIKVDSITPQNVLSSLQKLHSELDLYKFSNFINSLVTRFPENLIISHKIPNKIRCLSSQDSITLLKALSALSQLQFSSPSDYLYIHFPEAFGFLLATTNAKQCISIYKEFLNNKQHPCEKSFSRILEASVHEGIFDELKEALDMLLEMNKLGSNALKEVFESLKLANRCDIASKIIGEVPIDNPSIAYIWDFYVGNFCKGNEQVVKNTVKTVAKLNLPEKTAKIQDFYGILLDFLMKNNETPEFLFEVLFDVVELDLKVSGQTIRAFWIKCLDENFDFEALFGNLRKCVSLLDSYSVGLILKKLIQRNRKLETLRFLDFFINGNFSHIRFSDINLSASEFKYIIILQNQLNNFKEKSIKQGEILSEADIVENSDFSILDSFSSENFEGKK